jgi:hypothetical protein
VVKIPRGAFPRGRPRTEPVLDHVIRMSIDRANGTHHPESGRYAEVVLNGMSSVDHAREIRRALYRSARYMKVSLDAKIERSPGGGHQIRFTVVNKEHAQAYIENLRATAPHKVAYDPYARG